MEEGGVHVRRFDAFWTGRVSGNPPRDEGEADAAAEVDVAVETGPCGLRGDGDESGGIFDGGLPLNGADVGAAHHSDATVAPWLAVNPLNGVVTVLTFIVVRGDDAFGSAGASAILDDCDVACFGPTLCVRLCLCAVIGRAHEDDGRCFYGIVAIGVGGEFDAVAHGEGGGFDLDVGQGGATEGENGDEDFIHWGVFRGKGVMRRGG